MRKNTVTKRESKITPGESTPLQGSRFSDLIKSGGRYINWEVVNWVGNKPQVFANRLDSIRKFREGDTVGRKRSPRPLGLPFEVDVDGRLAVGAHEEREHLRTQNRGGRKEMKPMGEIKLGKFGRGVLRYSVKKTLCVVTL